MSQQRLKYKIQNWSAYNKSLVKRGSITLWFDTEVSSLWYASSAAKIRGRPQRYSDHAIKLCLVFKCLYPLLTA